MRKLLLIALSALLPAIAPRQAEAAEVVFGQQIWTFFGCEAGNASCHTVRISWDTKPEWIGVGWLSWQRLEYSVTKPADVTSRVSFWGYENSWTGDASFLSYCGLGVTACNYKDPLLALAVTEANAAGPTSPTVSIWRDLSTDCDRRLLSGASGPLPVCPSPTSLTLSLASVQTTVLPEPSTLLLLAFGLVSVAAGARRRRTALGEDPMSQCARHLSAREHRGDRC